MMKYDITIIGGGIVGLTLANALALKTDCRIAVIESSLPDFEKKDERVSAITPESKTLLQQINAWDLIGSAQIAPIEKMEVTDESSNGQVQFSASESRESALGFIIENRLIAKALWQALKMRDSRVDILFPRQWKKIDIKENSVEIKLDDATIITQLLIAADGSNSEVRNHLQMETAIKDYGQTAIVATVQCEKPHHNTAWQRFSSKGPAAFLPLPDAHHVSLVWSQDHDQAARLLALSEEKFNDELTHIFEGQFGYCKIQTVRRHFPLFERHALHYIKPRFALIGDAAHTLHPLAGQGLNLGLQDIVCLVDVITEAQSKQRDYTSFAALRRYERTRKSENADMMLAMQAFKHLFGSTNPYWIYARSLGFNTVNHIPALKNFFCRYAGA